MKILHVDSSITGPNSVSRMLTAGIVEQQKTLHPDIEVTYRDVAADAPFHLSGAHLAAWQGSVPLDADLAADVATGAELLEELFAADIIVVGAPMYNFSVPSQLKAWIDRLLIAGKSFRYGAAGPEGLLPKGKKVFIASSRGGAYGPETPAAFLEHQETYLRGALGFIGLTDVTVIRAEGVNMGPDAREAAVSGAKRDILALAA
ncbi:FMN-dependent NADH-azoreductase [Acidisphaera sp. S103]|uniref:FMN-dependent NADH-azoreductase n=1 Tax=Acidisphaera sp. S103 TaxID=1747223 RepID=UPI00131B3356|nr:FMN-dependent NADH-azoreductase [Acidisphaera sp. S103]